MTVACDGLGEDHAYSVLGAQSHHWASFDHLARRQVKIIFSKQRTENHEDLQHRVVAAYAASRPGSKRKISKRRMQFLVRPAKALRVELLGVLPVATRMVRAISEDNDRRSPRYGEIIEAIVRDRLAVNHPKRRIEAEGFRNDLRGELEPGYVFITQRLIA